MMERIALYDCTLRDGTQGEGIAFSVEDKIRIAEKLDELGIHYIEGGWPGSNPKDMDFFEAGKRLKLRHARLAAFGSTRRPGNRVSEDANIRALVRAQTPVITIFGKSWDFHVQRALRTSLAKNIELINLAGSTESTTPFVNRKQGCSIRFGVGWTLSRESLWPCLMARGERPLSGTVSS